MIRNIKKAWFVFTIYDQQVTNVTRVVDSIKYRKIIIDESPMELSSREVRVLFVSQVAPCKGPCATATSLPGQRESLLPLPSLLDSQKENEACNTDL
jgi:hypothetical protein